VIVERCPLFGQKWLSKAKKIVRNKGGDDEQGLILTNAQKGVK